MASYEAMPEGCSRFVACCGKEVQGDGSDGEGRSARGREVCHVVCAREEHERRSVRSNSDPLSDDPRSTLSAAPKVIEGSGSEVGVSLVVMDRYGERGLPSCVVRRHLGVQSYLKGQGGGPRRPGLTVG